MFERFETIISPHEYIISKNGVTITYDNSYLQGKEKLKAVKKTLKKIKFDKILNDFYYQLKTDANHLYANISKIFYRVYVSNDQIVINVTIDGKYNNNLSYADEIFLRSLLDSCLKETENQLKETEYFVEEGRLSLYHTNKSKGINYYERTIF